MSTGTVSEIEERLFILLDIVEKQTEENASLRKNITQLLETVKQQQAVIEKQNQSIVEQGQNLVKTSSQQMRRLEMTQQDFNHIIYRSVAEGMKKQVVDEIQGVASKAIIHSVSVSANAINDEMSSLVTKLNDWNEKADCALAKHYRFNLKKLNEITESLEYQQEKLGKQYFKLIAMIGGGLFGLMCVFFLVIYLLTVPTERELQRLRTERTQIQRQITQLSSNRNQWLNDARKNGYNK